MKFTNRFNENASMVDKFKAKAAHMVSGALIREADMNTKRSGMFFVSEPDFPIEMLMENKG